MRTRANWTGAGNGLGALVLVLVLAATTLSISPAGAVDDFDLVPVRTVGFSGHAGLYGWGAATMRDGSVLIGDYWNKRVLRYSTAEGSLGDLIGPVPFIQNNVFADPTSHQSPYGLAVDPDNGDVYLADTDRRQIDRYSETGTYIGSYGTDGVSNSSPGNFEYPSRVAIHDHRMYVADSWANSIVVYDVGEDPGDPIATVELFRYGTTGSGPGQFRQPRGLAFDAAGRLYVGDQGNKRIQVFEVGESSLTHVLDIGKPYDPEDPTPPADAVIRGDLRGVAVDNVNNWVYLVDGEGNRIHKFDLTGAWVSTIANGNGSGDGQFLDGGRELTVDDNGRVWVGDMPNFRAQVFDSNGSFIMAVPNPPEPPPDGGFNGPRGVAVDDLGNIFVTDTYNWRIVKLDAAGNQVTAWGTRGRGAYEFNYARLIAIDPSDPAGNQGVVIADTDNNRIEKYTNDGTFVWSVGSTGNSNAEFQNPHGIDAGPDGRIYVADSNNARIQVLGPDGHGSLMYLYEFNALAGSATLVRPRDVTVDTSDCPGPGEWDCRLWVTDATRDAVYQFENDGTYIGTVATPSSPEDALENPFGVTTDADNVYVADTAANQIKVWQKSDGAFLGAWAPVAPGGKALGKLLSPAGVDMAPGGNLYIAERDGERISHWHVGLTSPPVNTEPPVISETAQVGVELSTTDGSWTGTLPINFTYQWQRCDPGCSDITGQEGSTYTVTSSDIGASLTVIVTGTNSAGSSSVTATQTDVVPEPPAAPVNTEPPVISETAEVGVELSTTDGSWTGTAPIAFEYQWQRCDGACANITGAESSTYTVTSSDIGASLTVIVTGTNSAGSSSVTATQTGAVPDPDPENTFGDDDGSVHEAAIEAIAALGITKGCNPPDNDRFCPDDPVTRGAMAAFLNRALDLDPTGTDFFKDDDASVFEGDINRLAAAGITLGCNPPINNRYCPKDPVTRGAMAAFLNRALDLDPTGTDFFIDDDASVFEGDINRLAAAGITLGCNPPTNDQYCPNRVVTRAEMATFLARGLELDT